MFEGKKTRMFLPWYKLVHLEPTMGAFIARDLSPSAYPSAKWVNGFTSSFLFAPTTSSADKDQLGGGLASGGYPCGEPGFRSKGVGSNLGESQTKAFLLPVTSRECVPRAGQEHRQSGLLLMGQPGLLPFVLPRPTDPLPRRPLLLKGSLIKI